MTNIKLLFVLLPLLVTACALTAQSAAISMQPSPATLTPTQNMCQVKTGIEAGTLNLRTCGGTYCPTATILHEGETLTQTDPEAVGGWIPVRNSGGVQGWANSKFLDCQVGK
jgi:uncharacterized protein YgiM (DUF1202 family)